MRLIDPALVSMSDSDLEELREALYDTAQLAFDVYWWKKHGSKNPTGALTLEDKEATI